MGNYGEGEGCVDGDNDDLLGPVRWMVRSIVALTPAAEFRFAAEEYGVLYSFGAAGGGEDDGSTTVGGIGIVTERKLAMLALDAASTSRGGEGGIAAGSSLCQRASCRRTQHGPCMSRGWTLMRVADEDGRRMMMSGNGRRYKGGGGGAVIIP